jgi:hypothetical protein
MSPDTIPQISLGSAVLVIFAACVGFLMLRGLARMLTATIVLGLSAWAGIVVWREAPTFVLQFLGRTDPWLTTGLPVATFALSLILLRRVAKMLVRPLGDHPDAGADSTIPLPFRLLLALIPTTIICLIAAALIHHTGSVAELQAFAEEKFRIEEASTATFTRQLKDAINAALPESWLGKIDPLAAPGRLALAKEITAHSKSPPDPVIDPASGQPVPRAIIVDDPDLQNLARDGKFGTLLRHPLLGKWLNDPDAGSR